MEQLEEKKLILKISCRLLDLKPDEKMHCFFLYRRQIHGESLLYRNVVALMQSGCDGCI